MEWNGMKYGPLLYWHLDGGKYIALVAKKDDFSSTMRLSPPALTELEWLPENFTRSLSIRVQTTLNHIRFVVYHNIKDNERIFVKIC